ncbi:calphotin isoform X2 [Phyllopteryx taeniolatus]|uniref:calphotin isoform X2 n=1 Tax=Phyllopteryx taeniolatus TaxID=161469 RepID=UPI002AD4DC62|nr:calphotin isoform X2 [Phyllopteryx taeniolatus]
MEETLQQEIEYKSQNEEDQGGIRRRLRDRELLKRRRAETEEKETYQLESLGKKQRAEQRSGTKRRGRPRKTDSTPESSFTQECEVVEPDAPAVVVLPQSGEVIPALALDSLLALASGTLEPVLKWLPNPVLTPDPNVALVSSPDLVTPPIAVYPAQTQDSSTAPNIFPPPTAVLSALAQDLATVSDQTSAPNLAMPSTSVLPDLSTAPDQALAPDSDLVLPPTVVPLAPAQDLSTAPVQYSAPDVAPVSGPSQALVTEAVGTPYSAPQQVETLSTKTQDRENLDLVLNEDLGPDELEKDVPLTQDRTADAGD